MKGKLSLKNKIIIIAMALFLGATCLFVSLNKKQDMVVYAANPTFTIESGANAGQEFSAKFDGNILFSAEKVIMSSNILNDNYTTQIGDKIFYQRTDSEAGGEERKFYDYYNGTYISERDKNSDGKYVIEDNSFVMLNNIKDNNKYIVSGHSEATEAIIISFGEYIYDAESKTVEMPKLYNASTNKDPKNSGITNLKVTAYHDGEIITNLPGIRNIKHETDGRYYFDFMHIIPQADGNEGHYRFTFTYMVGGVECSASFEFYLMFRTSYTGTVEFKDEAGDPTNNIYNIEPTLGWENSDDVNFGKTTSTDGYVRYFIGNSGINNYADYSYVSYPTITYDYSKYTFEYTHTANGKESNYVFDYDSTSNVGNTLTGTIKYSIKTKATTIDVVKNLRYINEKNKLITIVLTDPGTYEFKFNYVYLGYNETEAPDMNLEVNELPNLYIHGAELNYSKYNYQAAEMRYLQASINKNDKVDVIFPTAFDNLAKTDRLDTDGKDIADFKNNTISFIYETNNESASRVGNIVLKESTFKESKETLINADLKSKNTLNITGSNDYQQLITKTESLASSLSETDYDALVNNDVASILEKIKYEKTNQGSLWFTLNDKYDVKSYYFYSTNKIKDIKELYSAKKDAAGNTIYLRNDINSETTFNKTGYYLVLLKIVPNAMTETNRNANAFYVVYAFEYSTSTINVDVVTTETNTVVGAGKFTKEDVTVTWKEPDVFERAISASFYKTTNPNASRSEILKTASYYLENGATLGDDDNDKVENGSYFKFLVQLKSEGESATYKMFTIDRQAISGVMGYVVAKNVATNNSSYYDYDTNRDGSYKQLTTSITDSFATLYWNDKNSGAAITTTYSYTPFVKESVAGTLINGIGSDKWITTNYSLGKTIGDFNIEKTELGNAIDFANVLSNQGIYVFTIIDEAGNSCKYAFVIDKTEAWFYLDESLDGFNNGGTYSTGSYKMFGDSFEYNVGNYKAFELDLSVDASLSEEEQKRVQERNAVIEGKFDNINYFKGNNHNKSELQKLFTKNGNWYLTVKNESVSAYDPQNIYDSNISSLSGKVIYSEEASGANTSLIRTLYIKGLNNSLSSVYTDNKDSVSRITFEINTDNAKGMVFYSSSTIKESDVQNYEESSANRLTTGSDKYNKDNGNLTKQGLLGAHATNSEYLVFTWQTGSGDYEVAEVYYEHFSLNTHTFDSDTSDGYNWYFYKSTGVPKYIYKDGEYSNGGKQLTGGNAYIVFGGSSITEDGLYKVTRTYKNDLAADSNDVKTLSYYFIVDRNKIIDVENSIGEHIKIKLLENETDFNTFNTINVSTGVINIDDLNNETYSIYLSTTKLPAVLQVPAGKYFDGLNGSQDYYSGQLGFKLYFVDNDNQLSGTDKGSTTKIFDSEEVRNGSNVVWRGASVENGCYVINIYDYIASCIDSTNSGIRSKLCVSDANKQWISLSGTYVLHVYDKIEPVKNKELLAFRITKGNLPNIKIESSNKIDKGYLNVESSLSNEDGYNYLISTNDEFVKLNIPIYDESEFRLAQVDPNYLKIVEYFDGKSNPYITHEYKMGAGKYTINSNEVVVANSGGFETILLDTYLRDTEGNILIDNISKELYYLVTIRYKLSPSTDSNNNNFGGTDDRYINCYKYYDANGNVVEWFEATYKVVIDRQAPTENLNNIIETDLIISDYNQKNKTDKMFENGVHEEGNDVYFTHQYAKYYQEKVTGSHKLSQIFAVKVGANTVFENKDIKKVLFRNIPVLSKLIINLPIAESDYEGKVVDLSDVETYGDIFGTSTYGYYEFIELDAAGNTTQYIVMYDDAIEYLNIPIMVDKTEGISDAVGLFETNELNLTVFNVYKSAVAINKNGDFFKIELTGNDKNEIILTDFSTDFNDLSEAIEQMFKGASAGEYTLTLSTRDTTKTATIIMYPANDENKLNARLLIDEEIRRIDLLGANYTENGIPYFAKQIVIRSGIKIDTYVTDDGGENYYTTTPEEERIPLIWAEGDNITYKITVTDVFGRTDTTNFNTILGYDGFYSIYLDGGDIVYNEENDYYYSYQSVYLKYDTTLASSFRIYENDILISESNYPNFGISIDGNIIKFEAYFETDTFAGKLYDFKVQFVDATGLDDESFNIVIDTRIPKVSLVDYATNASRDMKLGVNLSEEQLDKFISDKLNSGVANLSWEWPSNNYFYYTYTLRVQQEEGWDILQDSWVTSNNISSIQIKDGGTYQLIINVYGDEDHTLYLGNKVYAFNHASENEALYYVKDAEGKTIEANSSFKYLELKATNIDNIAGLTFDVTGVVPQTNLPLFITKQLTLEIDGEEEILNPMVVINDDLVINDFDGEKFVSENALYTFYMYKISTTTYSQYFGLMVLKENSNLVDSAKIGVIDNATGVIGANTNRINDQQTSFGFANNSTDTIRYAIQVSQKADCYADYLLRKNGLVLEVYYNNSVKPVKIVNNFATTTDGIAYTNVLNYEILGNGDYVFKIKDLAGNVQLYNGFEPISATVIREVVVTVNDTVPVDNAYYNDAVELRIYASAKYETGSISVSAELNGNPYPIDGFNPCRFEEFGNYKITITAKYSEGGNVYDVSRVVRFTILNAKEVRPSIDLTTISNYKITKVTDAKGNDVTQIFNKIINVNEGANAMIVTYDKVLKYKEELKISTGKQLYTITYLVDGLDYPPREIMFSFTLNNETPKIDCDLPAGETTTKGFTISFNPGILYEQIGEAYITINGEVAYAINEFSEYNLIKISKTFETDGDDDYYIQLVGSSGNVWVSYKATIKEPLNFWAIIIIIVVVVVVVGLTVTIIVLRNKMKVR